jgi:hypothetical protein
MNTSQEITLEEQLDAAVPGWREINHSPRFEAWLGHLWAAAPGDHAKSL